MLGDGPIVDAGIECPKCGRGMLVIPDSDWQLDGYATIGIICPNCLHTDRVDMDVIENGDDNGLRVQ